MYLTLKGLSFDGKMIEVEYFDPKKFSNGIYE